MNTNLEFLLASRGVIRRADHPHLRGAIDWALRSGQAVTVAPGLVAAPGVPAAFDDRVRIILTLDPDAIFTGLAAARLSFWPTVEVATIEVHTRKRVPPAWARFLRGPVPTELVQEAHGVRFTSPALTAIHLVDHLGGDAIDRVLRCRVASLPTLHRALELTPGRRGNVLRAALLADSRDAPWSQAERVAHRELRRAGFQGWSTNVRVVAQGESFFIDIAFIRCRLAVEIDSWEFHSSREAFEADRRRHNALVAAGWTVLHVTWRMLTDDPEGFVELLRQVMAAPSGTQVRAA